MDDRSPEMLKPTLLGGAVFGVAAAVPFLNLINCACCALAIGAGFLAAYLYSQECKSQGAAFRPGQGALVGLVAGAFYALTLTLVNALILLAVGDPVTPLLVEWFRSMPNFPPEAIDAMEQEMAQGLNVAKMVLGFFINLLTGAVFATLGGLIGGAAFRFEPPQQPSDPRFDSTPPMSPSV
jgi:hypothetical protein